MAGPMRKGIQLANAVDQALQEGDYAMAQAILEGLGEQAHPETLIVLLSNVKAFVEHIDTDGLTQAYNRLYSLTLASLRLHNWSGKDLDEVAKLLEIS